MICLMKLYHCYLYGMIKMKLEQFDNTRARKKSDIDCCKALRNIVKYHKDIVMNDLSRAIGELASEKAINEYRKKEYEDNDGGIGMGFQNSTKISYYEKSVNDYKDGLKSWEELDIFLTEQIEKII